MLSLQHRKCQYSVFADRGFWRKRRLRFVGLLAGADEVLDSFRGFGSLLLLELIHPARHCGNHVGWPLALVLSRGSSAGFLLHALFTLYNFYYFFF